MVYTIPEGTRITMENREFNRLTVTPITTHEKIIFDHTELVEVKENQYHFKFHHRNSYVHYYINRENVSII